MEEDTATCGLWTSGECADSAEADPAPTSRHERRLVDEDTTPDPPPGAEAAGLGTGAPAPPAPVIVELVMRGGAGVLHLAGSLANYLSNAAHVDASAEARDGQVVLRLMVPSAPAVGGEQVPRTLPRLPELDRRSR